MSLSVFWGEKDDRENKPPCSWWYFTCTFSVTVDDALWMHQWSGLKNINPNGNEISVSLCVTMWYDCQPLSGLWIVNKLKYPQILFTIISTVHCQICNAQSANSVHTAFTVFSMYIYKPTSSLLLALFIFFFPFYFYNLAFFVTVSVTGIWVCINPRTNVTLGNGLWFNLHKPHIRISVSG